MQNTMSIVTYMSSFLALTDGGSLALHICPETLHRHLDWDPPLSHLLENSQETSYAPFVLHSHAILSGQALDWVCDSSTWLNVPLCVPLHGLLVGLLAFKIYTSVPCPSTLHGSLVLSHFLL